MTRQEKTIRAARVADFIWECLRDSINANVLFSWGIRGIGAAEIQTPCCTFEPCLLLEVSALIHTGYVAIYKDIAHYEPNEDPCNHLDFCFNVALYDESGARCSDWYLYMTPRQTAEKIDELIEKPKGLTDEEYQFLALLDSEIKMMTEK